MEKEEISFAKITILIIVFFYLIYYLPQVSGYGLNDLDDEILVCEGSSLSYKFDVVGKDGFIFDLEPKNPFFIRRANENELEIFSKRIGKEEANKVYNVRVLIFDSKLVHEKMVNISVIEINNPLKVEDIGVYTLDISRNNKFYKKIVASDIEDGNQDSGNLEISLSFLTGKSFFEIKENAINISPKPEDVGNYEVLVCAKDRGIKNAHEKIGVCGQDGSSLKSCGKLYLSVTEKNSKPKIIERFPNETRIDVLGLEKIDFMISTLDSDGTKPAVYWYVDKVLKESFFGSFAYNFSYQFGCGIKGLHEIKAEIRDGLENDSVVWKFNVKEKVCANIKEETGQNERCVEKIACQDWNLCQNLQQSLVVGIISDKDYSSINRYCQENNWSDSFCGLQIRNCFDVNNCNSTIGISETVRACYFSINPNCGDNIKNCHDGSCEFLVDCGGQCKPCPTCSDRIQNQGEENVDCGGPCPKECLKKKPFIKITDLKYAVFVLVLGLIVFAVIKLIKVYKVKKDLTEIGKREVAEDEI